MKKIIYLKDNLFIIMIDFMVITEDVILKKLHHLQNFKDNMEWAYLQHDYILA